MSTPQDKKSKMTGPGGWFKSLARGETLFYLKCDKIFPHIIYGFFLICMILLTNIMIEKSMVKLEQNKKEIYDLRIYLTHKNSELVSIGKLSTIQDLLEKAGSDLTIPEEPATMIRR